MQDKSEEFDVISVKILPSEEGDTARDPTEATLWTEKVRRLEQKLTQLTLMGSSLDWDGEREFFREFLTHFFNTYKTVEKLTKSEDSTADSRSCATTRTRKPVFQNLAKRNKSLREAANKNNYERNKKKQINRYCNKRGY